MAFGPVAAIAVEDVCKGYRGWQLLPRRQRSPERHLALDHVSFSVAEGETVGVLGPNGAGKTTLLKIMASLLHVSAGRVLIHGRDVRTDSMHARRMIGLVTSDERSFYWRLTGRQNLLFFGALYGLPKSRLATRVADLLEVTGLTEAADRPFHGYSSGMKQRLAIARGFLGEPRIVLYDEPTRSLDPSSAQSIRRWIADSHSHAARTTHLIATNHMLEAEQLCGRVIIINRGTVLASGTLDQIRAWSRENDYVVHRVTYRGPALGGPWADSERSGVVDVHDESRGPDSRTLRVTAREGSAGLSTALTAILGAGGVVLRCETEQAPFDEVFCGLVNRTVVNDVQGAARVM